MKENVLLNLITERNAREQEIRLEYKALIANLNPNEAGEYSAKAILDINEHYDEQIKQLNRWFAERVGEI